MFDIQHKILLVNEKRKRDRALKKQKGKGNGDKEDVVLNASYQIQISVIGKGLFLRRQGRLGKWVKNLSLVFREMNKKY